MEMSFFNFFDRIDREADFSLPFLSAEVVKMDIISEKNIMILLKFDDMFDISYLKRMNKEITEKYSIENVSIKLKFCCKFEISCMPFVLYDVFLRGGIVNGFFDGAEYELNEEVLSVNLKHGGLGVLLAVNSDRIIEESIKEMFDKKIDVEFDGVTDIEFNPQSVKNEKIKVNKSDFDKIKGSGDLNSGKISAETYKDNKEKIVKPNEDRKAFSERKYGKKETAEYVNPCFKYISEISDIVYGKSLVKENPVLMSSISIESGYVTVVGRVFNTELREFKGGGKIFKLYLTDETGAFIIKFSGDAKKVEAVSEKIKDGYSYLVKGEIIYDKYERDIVLRPLAVSTVKRLSRRDEAKTKRVELHLHTNMSSMDAIPTAESVLKLADRLNHDAVAVTDHGTLQAFPDFLAAKNKLKSKVKIIYGIEAYIINDLKATVKFSKTNQEDTDILCDGEFVCFDLETTGLSAERERITEIGAVKMKGNKIVDTFVTFVNPKRHISEHITKLTGISDNDVKDAPEEDEALRKLFAFTGNLPLIAHNASFDIGFVKAAAERCFYDFDPTYIDTLAMVPILIPEAKGASLKVVADALSVGNFNHHRALDDAKTLSKIFVEMVRRLENRSIYNIGDINKLVFDSTDYRKLHYMHEIILVKNMVGLKNLYKLASNSYLNTFYSKPLITRSELIKYREGLIVGSACEAGELYSAIKNGRATSELLEIASFYDYLEIQPLGNNEFMLRDEKNKYTAEDLVAFNKTVIDLGGRLNIPVVATSDTHFLNAEDRIYRAILQSGTGFSDADRQAPLYYRTTDEMLKEFEYLDYNKAYEIVIENTRKIADMCEDIKPIPDGTYTPSIDGAEDELKNIVYETARKWYGDELPEIVSKRLDKEMSAIIKHGFSVMYIIAEKLVKNSKADGYYVGSRGSVGSSLVATMSGITEVNPLPPHYLCKNCRYSDFQNDENAGSGFDLSERMCPRCGEKLTGDGHDIPFETFLGFNGEKAPDIDLNFSGEYQATAHKYIEEIFGEKNVFRAGTISTIADKTAETFVYKYNEERGKIINKAEEIRLASGFTGVRRTTGQHPGGIVVIPKDCEIFDFTPIQHPADDKESGTVTTHFAFESLHDTILKLDILGHDVPTIYKRLEECTGVMIDEVPMNDPQVYKMFVSTEPMGVDAETIFCETSTLAIPEMKTPFVRQMLVEANPKNFSDLLQVSGLSHGKGVWLGNARDLINNGTCNISEVIGTRDNIMLYLMHKGMDSSDAFKITESVRKGKGISIEFETIMKNNNIPDWYIDSCKKITYMFPKAHAAAYVCQALCFGWYKLYYPLEFYASYFTVKSEDFDESMAHGRNNLLERMKEIRSKGKEASAKDKDELEMMELVNEMYARGFEFRNVDFYKSDATRFLLDDGKIRPPINSLKGVGTEAAKCITNARNSGEIQAHEDLLKYPGISKTTIASLKKANALTMMPEERQMSLF